MKSALFALIIAAVCFNSAFGATDIIVSSEDPEWLNNVWKTELVKSEAWNLKIIPAPAIEIIVSSDNLFWSDNNIWKAELVKSDKWNLQIIPDPAIEIVVSSDNLLWSDNNIWKSDLVYPSDIPPDTNTPPTISDIKDQSTKNNTPTGAISFTVSDAETKADDLIITGSSSDTELVPNNNIIFGGSGNNRTVTITPATNKFGVTIITVKVSDGRASASDSFNLTVEDSVPVAIFTATPSFGPPPLKVSLDASASYSPGSSISSYSWSSSDNQTGSGKTASMTFNKLESYTVTLTVKDNNGKTASAQKIITAGYPVCQDTPFDTSEYNDILQEMKKGEFESSANHKQRLKDWNNEKHTYCFEMEKFQSYDADRGVLFARILTDPLQIAPVIYEIKIESIGTGQNVADFINNMYVTAALEICYGATESELHLYLSEDSIQIEPKDSYSSARKIVIIEGDGFYEDFAAEKEKKWYETTSEWEARIAAYESTILADIITQPENQGYGYNADTGQMKISLDLSGLKMGIKEYILIDMDKNDVIPFVNTGWATVTVKINPADISIKITETEIRLGEVLLNYIETENKGDYSPLTPPTDINAFSGTDSVKLTWQPGYGAYFRGYNVYRSESESGQWNRISAKTVTGDYYKDNSLLSSGKKYYYYLTSTDSFNNESRRSDIVSAIFGHVKFFIPDARGKKGDIVKIPVNIANSDGIRMSSADIYVIYDPAVLSAKGLEKTALSSNYGLSHSLESGAVKAVITSNGDTLYGDASLFYILFDVKEESGTSELKFNPEKTFFYKYNENNATVKAATDLSDTGIFTVGGGFILGDMDGDSIVNSNDIVTALHIAVGKIDPTREKLNAGDVSGDGRIMANDASLITRIALNLPLVPPASASKTSKESSSKIIKIYLPDIKVSSGSSVWVPVKTDNAEDIAGGDIVISYDPSSVTATGLRKTSLTENFDMQFNIVKPGYVRISFSSSDSKGLSHNGEGTLAEVQFTAKYGVSPMTLTSVRLNDTYGRDFATSALQISVTSTNGSITAGEPGDTDHNGSIDLKDAVLCLKIIAGINENTVVYKDTDVNSDGKIGLEEIVYILQKIAKIR